MEEKRKYSKKEEVISVPYIVFESVQQRTEMRTRRLHMIILALVVLLVITNMSWLFYEAHCVRSHNIINTTDGITMVDSGGEVDFN